MKTLDSPHLATAPGLIAPILHLRVDMWSKLMQYRAMSMIPNYKSPFSKFVKKAHKAAEYLEVSMSTFRRFVSSAKLSPSSMVGRNQMFAVADLKAFKKALKIANG